MTNKKVFKSVSEIEYEIERVNSQGAAVEESDGEEQKRIAAELSYLKLRLSQKRWSIRRSKERQQLREENSRKREQDSIIKHRNDEKTEELRKILRGNCTEAQKLDAVLYFEDQKREKQRQRQQSKRRNDSLRQKEHKKRPFSITGINCNESSKLKKSKMLSPSPPMPRPLLKSPSMFPLEQQQNMLQHTSEFITFSKTSIIPYQLPPPVLGWANSYPEQKSMYIKPEDVLKKLNSNKRKRLCELLQNFGNDFEQNLENYLFITSPGYMGNKIVPSHESKQPIRIVFGLDVSKDIYSGKMRIKRFNYAPMAVIKYTGLHPNDFRVLPLCQDLKLLVDLVIKEVLEDIGLFKSLKRVSFNTMEIKIYYNNHNHFTRKCGAHTDCDFNENGHQSDNDTTVGSHPICTFTVGASRQYTYFYSRKHATDHDAKWKGMRETRKNQMLEDGSIWILHPDDEKPKRIGDYYYKTKHEAKLLQKGISIAFVFRCVKDDSLSLFNSNNEWLVEHDHSNELKRLVRLKMNTKTAKDIEKSKTKNLKNHVDDYRNGDYVKQMGTRINDTIQKSLFFQQPF